MQRRLILPLLLAGSLLCLRASAQEQQRGLEKLLPSGCQGADAVLDITSERMTFDQRTRIFVFEEKVQARRCAMTMTCDRLQVTNNAKDEQVERLLATGNVHVQQGTRHVVAERAEYFAAEQRLVLTGNPRAWDTQEQRELTGEEITVFLQSEDIIVKRARVLFRPRTSVSKRP